MKYLFLFAFLLLASAVSAQTIHQSFEVQTEAQPTGGAGMLEQFIIVNRRMPYAAEVAKVKGSVVVTGVVEPNGRMSDIKVVRGLHPACDREAVRVMSLYNAWKPATKDGKPVRQQFSYLVRFAPTRPGSEPGRVVTYYGTTGDLTADSVTAAFRMIQPVDTAGFPTQAPVVQKRKQNKWLNDQHYYFREEPTVWQNPDNPFLPDSVRIREAKILNPYKLPQGTQYAFYDGGGLFFIEKYGAYLTPEQTFQYAPSGMVIRMTQRIDSLQRRRVTWHPNGQLYQVLALQSRDRQPELVQVVEQWDSVGNQQVHHGTGKAQLLSRELPTGWVSETGNVVNGLQDSVWTGRSLKTDALLFRHTYDRGRFVKGESYTPDGKTTTYDVIRQQPEFVGGQSALGYFLSTHLRYPPEAAKQQIQGKVHVTFIIAADGSVSNVSVSKGVHPLVDAEAVRVVKATNGQWQPGIQRGKPVRVKFNLPINFALN